ncbi:hypothetical protein TrST_g6733 [Triparma strigata]|uniref:Uncharacterized protein n=1 Tax=Triparma strigata TaxID=1606541 RepID=A0A9W7C0P2_9STRA|nr:hypothetical protein TrST_g6733 [Triparma strigata]
MNCSHSLLLLIVLLLFLPPSTSFLSLAPLKPPLPPPAPSFKHRSLRLTLNSLTSTIESLQVSHNVTNLDPKEFDSAAHRVMGRQPEEILVKTLLEYSEEKSKTRSLGSLTNPPSSLPSLGPTTTSKLSRTGLTTIRSLLFTYPKTYTSLSPTLSPLSLLEDGSSVCLPLKINSVNLKNTLNIECCTQNNDKITLTHIFGSSSRGRQVLKGLSVNYSKKMREGEVLVVSGNLKRSVRGDFSMLNPQEVKGGGVKMGYGMGGGASETRIKKGMKYAVEAVLDGVWYNTFPVGYVNGKLSFVDGSLLECFDNVHFPEGEGKINKVKDSIDRLAFESLFVTQLRLLLNVKEGVKLMQGQGLDDELFTPPTIDALDETQVSAVDEICSTTHREFLLSGDVGSGKTIVAYNVLLKSKNKVNYYVAPTTVLARQVYGLFKGWDNLNDITTHYIDGGVVGKRRDDIMKHAKNGDIIVGTIALSNIMSGGGREAGVVILDEEQRYGEKVKSNLSNGSYKCVRMSATPIPRTLKSSDLQAGVKRVEIEGRRWNVETRVLNLDRVEEIIDGVRRVINADKGVGKAKVLWICPAIDKEVRGVLERGENLSKRVGEGRVGIVHGRMKTEERIKRLEYFQNQESGVDIMVGTTVLEVGVDLVGVDVIVVENAERFGLSSLHQLRGRVGRKGGGKAVFLVEGSTERVSILEETDDGLKIAERDLSTRGPGELLGIRQSGLDTSLGVNIDEHYKLLSAAGKRARILCGEEVDVESGGDGLEGCLAQEGVKKWVEEGLRASSAQGMGLRYSIGLFSRYDDQLADTYRLLAEKAKEKCDDLSGEDVRVDQLFIDWATRLKGKHLEKEGGREKKKVDEGRGAGRVLDDEEALELSGRERATDKARLKKNLDLASGNGIIKPPNPRRIEPRKKFPNLSSSSTCFVCLDVETTGLSRRSSYIIQIAAKMLHSSDARDSFSAYVLPPPNVLKGEVESLTGITDTFLREGGMDTSTGVMHGPAMEFDRVYDFFCKWCRERGAGRDVVLIAHNARFDLGMLNSEISRLRRKGNWSGGLPSLAHDAKISSVVDTLPLLRTGKLWKMNSMARPGSFKQGDLYEFLFDSPMAAAHNAMGDVLGLEAILEGIAGWKDVAQGMQTALVEIVDVDVVD